MSASRSICLAAVMACLGSLKAVAQDGPTRVIIAPAGDYGNVYTVAYALLDNLTVPKYYQITLCGPRDMIAGTLESYWLRLEDDNGGTRFSSVSSAIVDEDFARTEFGAGLSEIDNIRVFANYYRGAPEERYNSVIEMIDFAFLPEPSAEIDVRPYSLSCRDLADAVVNAED